MSEFLLASASPRRSALLRAAGFNPRVVPADIDERALPKEMPIPYALRVASRKAIASDPGDLMVVLAADTVVALDGEILGKAADVAQAVEMLRRLSARTHVVHTAIVVRCRRGPAEEILTDTVSTEVRFRRLGLDEIERYVASGDPLDKAGSYGIQGEGAALVAEVHGSYTNVVGLPLEETLRLLQRAGIG